MGKLYSEDTRVGYGRRGTGRFDGCDRRAHCRGILHPSVRTAGQLRAAAYHPLFGSASVKLRLFIGDFIVQVAQTTIPSA